MIKSNLPVILLKGLVLLPHAEVRIELNNDISKKVIELSNLYHDDEVLIVCPINNLEENPDTSDLPKIGVVGKVKNNITLPNGNERIVIEGLYRVKVFSYVNYSNETDILESIIEPIETKIVSEIEETALLRKLFHSLEEFISVNANISNSILSQITGLTDLDKLTDLISNFINLSFEKKFNLMCDASSTSRAKILIKELAIETSIINLEKKIDEEIDNSINKSQKDYVLKEKIKLMKEELGETSSKENDINKFKEILNNGVPFNIKNKILKEINRYSMMSETSAELSIERNYIDTVLSIPFNKYNKNIKDIKKVKESLDKTHYGLIEAKTRIIEYIAIKSLSEGASLPIICLVGPPGTGKTTFAYSVSEALGKNFSKISLGGMNDVSELIGHRRTYVGAAPGKIITSLIKSNTMNPVILLDEVDKISKDYKGDPSSILLDILDPVTNKTFVDNFIEEEIDLSNVLFILTANDENFIPKALLDRLEVIHIDGYSATEKVIISQNYLINRILKRNDINKNLIKITDEALFYLITSYTKESGIRELERLLNKIIRKIITEYIINKKRLSKILIKEEIIYKYLGTPKYNIKTNKDIIPGLVNGMAYSNNGGVVIEVETITYKGTGKIKCTGRIGKITNESIYIVLSYIRSNIEEFNLKIEDFKNEDFHINFRNSSIIKEGASAGVVVATSIISYLKNKKVPSNIALTGEISLNGDITGVSGLKEKILAASYNGINKIFVPFDNKHEIELLKKEFDKKINFIFVKNYKEIYNYLFSNKK